MTHESEGLDDVIDILLVEPNSGDCRLFTESFADANLLNTVYTVTDGAAALDFVHQRDPYADAPRPDLILLEPQLPDTDGDSILSELEGEPELSEIPVAVLTSSTVGTKIVKSHGLDAEFYVEKPVEREDFISFVDAVEEFWFAIVRDPAES